MRNSAESVIRRTEGTRTRGFRFACTVSAPEVDVAIEIVKRSPSDKTWRANGAVTVYGFERNTLSI